MSRRRLSTDAERVEILRDFLRGEQDAIKRRGDGRELASSADEYLYDAIGRVLQETA